MSDKEFNHEELERIIKREKTLSDDEWLRAGARQDMRALIEEIERLEDMAISDCEYSSDD